MNTLKLIEAIQEIKRNHLDKDEEIIFIEFEDGSGNCFNYRTNKSRKQKFIRLKLNQMITGTVYKS